MKYNGSGRWWVIAAAGAVFLLSLLLAGRLQLDERITSMLPGDDPVVSRYLFVMERFHLMDALYIDIEVASDSPESKKGLVAVADALYDELHRSGWFANINYKIPKENFINLLSLLNSRTARLITPGDLPQLSQRLEPGEIHHRLAAAKRRLIEPSGPFLRAQVRRDPLDLDEIVLEKLESLREEAAGVQMEDGCLWSADSKHILMIASPVFPAVDTRRGEKLAEFLNQARRRALETARGGQVRISFAGTHLATLDNSEAIKSDVSRATIALSLGLVLLGGLVFRHRLFIVLIFFPAMFGIALAAGFMAVIDPLISAIALGCGTVLMGIAVDYGVPILYHLDNSPAGRGDHRRIVRRLTLPLLMGAGTTIAGFLGLMFLSFPGQRQMGLFSGLGIMGAVLFAVLALRFFIPSRLGVGRAPLIPLASLCCRFLEWRTRHDRTVLLAGMAVLALCSYGITRLRFDGDVSRLNHLKPETKRDSERLQEVWGTFSPTMVVVQGNTIDTALDLNDQLFQVLSDLQREGKIERFSSLAPVLPSARRQEENLQGWREFWSPSRMASLRAGLDQAMGELGFSPGVFEPFYQAVGREPPPLTVKDFQGTALEQLIRTKIVSRGKESYVLNSFTLGDRSLQWEVSGRIAVAIPGAVVMDKRHFVEHMASLVSSEFTKLAFIAFLAIVLCLFLFFWRVELVLANILPLLLSVVITLGVLGLCGISLNLMGILFVVFIFGVGVDFSIFLMSSTLDRYRGTADQESVSIWCGAVVICALTTIGGFLTIVFARHAALFSIGITGLIAMISSLGTSLVTVPAFTGRLVPHEGRYGTPSLKTMAGAAWAFVYLAGMAQLYAWFLRFFARWRFRHDPEARRSFTRRYMHRVAVGLLKFFPYRHRREIYLDADPEKFRKPAVIVSNHQSAFDIMLMLALPGEMVMVVKRWVWEAPFLGRLVRDAGYLLVREDSGGADALTRAEEYLEKGVSVMFFPEGSRSPDIGMRRFHVGAFKLAVETGSDVIPILISNSQSCIPYKAFWVGNCQAVVRVLPRVTKDNFDYSLGARELSRHVKKLLQTHEPGDWRLAQDGQAFWHNIRSMYNYRGAYMENYIAWKLRLDPIYRGIDPLVPQEGTVLDLGCGYGLMSTILARKSRLRQVIGLDFDAGKFRVCRGVAQAVGNLEFRQEDFLSRELPPADAVLMIDVLHYWSEELQLKAIAKACLALREGGSLVFREACKANSLQHLVTCLGERFSVGIGHNRKGTGLHFLDREFYLGAFFQQGLELVSEPEGLGRGSNAVFVFRKVAGCHTKR